VPYIQATQVVPRFLRLGPGLNQWFDPATDPLAIVNTASARIRDEVPGKLATVLTAPHIPDLSALGGPPVFLRNLTVQTVGDGHLGVYVDVATSPDQGASPVSVYWLGEPNVAPTWAVTMISPTAIPGVGPYTVHWTLKDATNGAVLYQSPAGGESYPADAGPIYMWKTLAASQFAVGTDPCSGDHSQSLQYALSITRGGYTKNVSGGSNSWWAGTPPSSIPPECLPEPEPEPEPEPDPGPSICDLQPWKCPNDL
jgi:hypothetical protein